MEKILRLKSDEEAIRLYGSLDENLRYAEKTYKVKIFARNNRLTISGNKGDVEGAVDFFHQQLKRLRGEAQSLEFSRVESESPSASSSRGKLFHKGKMIAPKSDNQGKYIDAIWENDVVFGIGPAGTGKTYLAVAMAVECLKQKTVKRIILTRPAVEAGESLGFLPGDLQAKINPYLRPLYDALYDMMEFDQVVGALDHGMIEIAPLAYMRGRTLNDAFVILDEGQNTTSSQMKMFLTRLGVASKAVITGDVTQVDLPAGKISGLIEAERILAGIKGIEFVQLKKQDIVRHRLVRDIVHAYEKHAQ